MRRLGQASACRHRVRRDSGLSINSLRWVSEKHSVVGRVGSDDGNTYCCRFGGADHRERTRDSYASAISPLSAPLKGQSSAQSGDHACALATRPQRGARPAPTNSVWGGMRRVGTHCRISCRKCHLEIGERLRAVGVAVRQDERISRRDEARLLGKLHRVRKPASPANHAVRHGFQAWVPAMGASHGRWRRKHGIGTSWVNGTSPQ